jgi:hypothetical protein
MAEINPARIVKLAGAKPALHILTTDDVLADVQSPSYFDPIAMNLHQGDIIICVSGDGAQADVLFVSSEEGVTPITIGGGAGGVTATAARAQRQKAQDEYTKAREKDAARDNAEPDPRVKAKG